MSKSRSGILDVGIGPRDTPAPEPKGDGGPKPPKPRLTLLLGAEDRLRLQALAEDLAENGAKTPRGDDVNEHFLAVHLLRWAIDEAESGRQQVRVTRGVAGITIGEGES